MLKQLKKRFYNFIENDKQYPILSGFAAGFYPIIYYYSYNFAFVNSWNHLIFFLVNFLLVPISFFCLIYYLIKKKSRALNKYVLSGLGLATFIFFSIIVTYGKETILIIVVAIVLSFFIGAILHRHSKKIIVIQLLLGLMISVKLIPFLLHYIRTSSEWLNQPDNIEEVVFEMKPNIYIIQPDGYVGFSKVDKRPYNFDNSEFKSFLEENQFQINSNYRSNYYSTVSSNASLFVMRHHYFNNAYNFRRIIAGKNPVISAFKNNGYTTNLILENSYMLVNKPKLYYDYCNINYDEVATLSRGFEKDRNTIEALEKLLQKSKPSPSFNFIERIAPGHITRKSNTSRKSQERVNYLSRIKDANTWLKEVITLINREDRNGLIIITADHGGFVGLNHTGECSLKLEDEALVNSIYSALFAIKLPENYPSFHIEINSPVNLFRTLFSYLSRNKDYLHFLQPNESYTRIKDGNLSGVYRIINNEGDVVFEKNKN